MRGTMGWVIALVAAVLCHATIATSRPWGSSRTRNSNHDSSSARKGSKHGFFLSTPSSLLTAWLSSAVVPTSNKGQRRTLHRKFAANGDEDDDEGGSDVEEEEEEESTESEDSIPTTTSTQRDNIGHDQSKKIKLAPKRASAATTDDDGDDGGDGSEEAKKATDVDADTSAPPSFQLSLLKQFAPTVVYMVASRFIMKLNFADSGVVQMCRIIFAVYLLLSQVMFTVLKQRIEAANDR